MAKKKESMRARLRGSMEARQLVRVSRTTRQADQRDGFIAAVGKTWILIATIDDRIRPDGFSALRIKDVSRVKRLGKTEAFVVRVLKLRGQWPLPDPNGAVDLSSTPEVVKSMGEAFPLISLFIEGRHPSVCYIGELEEVGRRVVRLREISPSAEWEDVSRWKLSEITRLEAGGGYEGALWEVAVQDREDASGS
jgi:hypothetical protein